MALAVSLSVALGGCLCFVRQSVTLEQAQGETLTRSRGFFESAEAAEGTEKDNWQGKFADGNQKVGVAKERDLRVTPADRRWILSAGTA
jgi:hypothetical protein